MLDLPLVTDPTSSIPGDIYSGPYGFLVAIAFLLWLAAKEWRKARQEDVAHERELRQKAEAERDANGARASSDITKLNEKVDALTAEITALKDQSRRDREAALERYYLARQMLIERGVSPEEIP